MSRDYAPCAHHALYLHYAETGLAAGFTTGIALAATALLITRAIRNHKAAAR